VSLVPASMQQVHSDGVTYRAIAKPAPTARLSVVLRPDGRESPHIRNLLTMVHQLVSTLPTPRRA
jgi:hypothetical protein